MEISPFKLKRAVPIKHMIRPANIQREKRLIKQFMHNSIDLQLRYIGENIMVVFLYSVVDEERIEKTIISPLRFYNNESHNNESKNNESNNDQYIQRDKFRINNVITSAPIGYSKSWRKITKDLTKGFVAVFIKGEKRAVLVAIPNIEKRAIVEPESEKLIRGPREGFIENINVNMSLLRKRMNSPALVFEGQDIGSITETKVVICYVAGICDPEIVQEVKKRLSLVNIQSVLDTGYLEAFIVDHPKSIFPQVEISEKPDKILAQIIEGRVAIMVDGTPNVMVVPTIYTQFVQASEDYYEKPYYATFLRYVRMLAMLIALFLPGLYVALTTIHLEMLPTDLALSIAGTREGVPFPAVVEALLMEIAFEMLREAGVRLPIQVGQAVSIVGALVIGQAAVDAGIVSPIMVIIVAFSGISSFLIPAYQLTISLRLLRFIIIIASSVLGLFGIVLIAILLLVHLASMQSYGIPYFEPLAPLKFNQLHAWNTRQSWRRINKQPYNVAINRMENKTSPENPPISERGNYRR